MRKQNVKSEKDTILYIDSAQGSGGATKSLLDLLRYLNKTRYRPILLNHIDGIFTDKFIQAGVTILPYKLKLMSALMFDPYFGIAGQKTFIKKMVKIIGMGIKIMIIVSAILLDYSMTLWACRKYRVRIIHYNIYSDYYLPMAVICSFLNMPIIFHIRGKLQPSRYVSFCTKYVDAFIHVSNLVQETFLHNGQIAGAHYCVYDGRDPDDYEWDCKINKTAFKESLGIPSDHKTVVCLGTLTRGKGQTTFVEAASIVSKEMDMVTFLIVGDNMLYEDDVKAELVKQVEGHGLSDRILFLGQRGDVPYILTHADISVSSSELPEALCCVNIEAMAAYIPVVSTDVGAVSEVVIDGETGILVEPSRPEQMAQAILKLLNNNEMANQFANAGYQRFLSLFNIQKITVDIENIYNNIMHQ